MDAALSAGVHGRCTDTEKRRAMTARQRRKARRASCWRIDYASSVIAEASFVQAFERSDLLRSLGIAVGMLVPELGEEVRREGGRT